MLKKSFEHLKEGYYYHTVLSYKKDVVDEIYLTVDTDTNAAQFVVEWINLGNIVAARFRSFDDTWWALPHIMDVLVWLSQTKDLTAEQLCEYLKSIDYADETPRVNPYE